MAFREVKDIQLDQPAYREVTDIQLDEPGVTPTAPQPITAPEPAIPPTKEPGFVGGVSEALGKRKKRFEEFVERQEHPFLEAPKIAAVGTAQMIGGLEDIIGGAVVSGYEALVPEDVQQTIKQSLMDFSQTKAGRLGIEALKSGQEAFTEFEKAYPDAAIALGSMANIFGVSVGTKGAKLTAKELVDVSKDISTIAGKTVGTGAEKEISNITRKAIERSIRPSVVRGRTAPQAKQYFDKASDAVQSIIENKEKLRLTDDSGNVVKGLPTNLKQFSEAINSTKRDIFQRYDEIAKLAGDAGAEVDLKVIANELDSIINNKGLLATSPDVISHAQSVKNSLSDIATLTAEEAQDAITALNNRLSTVTDFNSAAKASVDSLVANRLRKSLNDVIEKATGTQYNELKKKYGSLKAIEKDVNHRAMIDARKNVKGLIDFTDVFTGAEVVRGIISMSPATISAGLTGKGIAAFTKALNDPNRMIKNMFSNVEDVLKREERIRGKFKPESMLIKKATEQRGTTI